MKVRPGLVQLFIDIPSLQATNLLPLSASRTPPGFALGCISVRDVWIPDRNHLCRCSYNLHNAAQALKNLRSQETQETA